MIENVGTSWIFSPPTVQPPPTQPTVKLELGWLAVQIVPPMEWWPSSLEMFGLLSTLKVTLVPSGPRREVDSISIHFQLLL